MSVDIPVILTDANWQTQKGVVAKIFKRETGIGELMKKIGVAHAAVNWLKFDPYGAIPNTSDRVEANILLFINTCKPEYPKVQNLQKAVVALRDHTKILETEWKKSKLIPSSSTKHLGKIIGACETFTVALKDPDGGLIARMRKEAIDNEAKGRSMIATWISSIKAGNITVNATPTYEIYTGKMYQKVRGLGTAIGNIPQYKTKWSPIFGNAGFAKGDYIAKADSPETIKTKTKAIMAQLALFEAEL